MDNIFQYLAEGSRAGYAEFQRRLATVLTENEQAQLQLRQNSIQKQAAQNEQAAQQFQQQKAVEWFKVNNTLNANINTLNTINGYRNKMIDNVNSTYQQNIDSIQRSAFIDQQKANKEAARYSGQVRNAYAASGIIVDTGTPESVRQFGLNEIFSKSAETYAEKHNSIRQLLSEITKNEAQKAINNTMTQNDIMSLQNKVNML